MSVITGKTIDHLNQVTAITASDELVVYDAEAGTAEPTKKVTGQNAAESLKNLGNMVDLSDIAPAYSASATYDVGDYCIYNGAFYKCSTAITTAEPWTAAHWTQTTVQAELALKVNTADVVDDLTSTAKDKPLSAAQGKVLGDSIAYHEYNRTNGSSTSITSYSTSSNPYTVPEDGYIRVTGTNETIQWVGSVENYTMLAKSDGATVISVFVRKGMNIFIENPSGARYMQFRAPV